MVDADKEMSGPGSSAKRPRGQRDGPDSDKPCALMTARELLKTADTTRTMTEGVKEAEWGGTGPDGAKVLTAATHLASLTRLDLRDNNIGPEGADALAAATHLAKLTRPDLCHNGIG